MFGWFLHHVDIVDRYQNFTLLKRKVGQGEHEDLIEDGYQALGHCRCFLGPHLAMVVLHTDLGIYGYKTETNEALYVNQYANYECMLYFYDASLLPASELSVGTVLTLSSPTSILWEVGRYFKERSTSPTRSCIRGWTAQHSVSLHANKKMALIVWPNDIQRSTAFNREKNISINER